MPFFFLCLLEATVASSALSWSLEEDADPALVPASGVAPAGWLPPWISFTCGGGGNAWVASAGTLGFSSWASAGGTWGCSSLASAGAGAGLAAASGEAVIVASAVAGASERGAFSLAAGTPFTVSIETDLSPPNAPPRAVGGTTEVGLIGVGSTSVGSPTWAASATFGCLANALITLESAVSSLRLSSSALFCATAALVGLGTGWCMPSSRSLALSARSITG